MKSIIHINRHHIVANAKDGGNRPVYTIKQGKKTRYARQVIWDGPTKAIYDGSSLACGAKAWLETNCVLTLIDEMTFVEARDYGQTNV